MSAFPLLKTGAVAQYPAGWNLSYATAVFNFLDGSQQKCRQLPAVSKSWVIQLDLLDDTELTGISEFFQSQQGRFGAFSFQDPWDGTVYPNCSFASDELQMLLNDEGRGGLKLVIQENKN
jgi:hypothetical protein